MFDKIVSVCLNPSLDTTIWINKYDINEPVRAIKEKIYPGGKSVNVSRVLTSLGIENQLISFVGKENLNIFDELLLQEKITDVNYITVDGAIRENLSIVTLDNELLKINRDGFSVNSENLDCLASKIFSVIENSKSPLIVFAGSLPKGIEKQEYKELILKFRAIGAKICIDTDIFTFEDIKELNPFVIKPNHIELSHIATQELKTREHFLAFAKTLTPYVEHILVSLGAEGLLYLSTKQTIFCPAAKVLVKSTVGAGDTTLAGFITALFEGQTIAESVNFALQCGTASVQLDGTDIINRENI